MTSARLSRLRLSDSTLAANLERETQARLKAEAHVKEMQAYMETLPYPSDLTSIEIQLDNAFKVLNWGLGLHSRTRTCSCNWCKDARRVLEWQGAQSVPS